MDSSKRSEISPARSRRRSPWEEEEEEEEEEGIWGRNVEMGRRSYCERGGGAASVERMQSHLLREGAALLLRLTRARERERETVTFQ